MCVLLWWLRIGEIALKVTRLSTRLALVATFAVALAVGGCGRKGPLEAPPSTSTVAAPPPPQGSLGEPEHVGIEGERRAEQAPPAAQQKKAFFLDWLVN
jgi:predicted small lipoprotein YifL